MLGLSCHGGGLCQSRCAATTSRSGAGAALPRQAGVAATSRSLRREWPLSGIQVQAKQRGELARCLFQAGGLIAVGQRLAPLSEVRTLPLKGETLDFFFWWGRSGTLGQCGRPSRQG